MEELFQKLKEKYSCYGLGDDFLRDFAEWTNKYWEVDDGLKDAYPALLKIIQRANDKRAIDAAKSIRENVTEELETGIKMLDIKARLAANIFNSLAEHKGTSVLEYLTKETIETTNEIFNGISTVVSFDNRDISIV